MKQKDANWKLLCDYDFFFSFTADIFHHFVLVIITSDARVKSAVFLIISNNKLI